MVMLFLLFPFFDRSTAPQYVSGWSVARFINFNMILVKFLRARSEGFRGIRVYAVAFPAFDKGFYSLLHGTFFVSLDFFSLYFKLVAFSANLCEVMENTYLQLCNNRVSFGNGRYHQLVFRWSLVFTRLNAALEWTPQMEAKLPVIAAPNPGAYIEASSDKNGGITWKPTPSRKLQFYLGKKARYWNVYKWFIVIFNQRRQWLKNVIFKQTPNSCKRRNGNAKNSINNAACNRINTVGDD